MQPSVSLNPASRLARGLAVLGTAALLMTSCSSTGANGSTPDSESLATGSGQVTIGEDSYPFVATTCLADNALVVAEGPGTGGESFFVTVDTSGQVRLAFGVDSGTEDPTDERPWFQSVDEVDFQPAVAGWEANVSFVDANADAGLEMPGKVTVRCDNL